MKHRHNQAPKVEPPAAGASSAAAMLPMLDGYFDPAELAEELDVSERTVHRWHAMKVGPPRVTIGRRPLYKRTSVAAWIERQERDPAAASTGRRRTP